MTWRRVASPGSRGGSENEALLETVEIDRSDMDIAGLMVRCRDRKLEPIVVLIEPQPPGSKAVVTLSAGASRQTYVASPIPTGAGLSVPLDIVQNVQNNWVNQSDLSIEVEIAANTISGVVKLDGLADQVTKLQTDCMSGH